MKINFTETGWRDYLYWEEQDKKTLKQINKLIADIERNGYVGIGKPEPLRGGLSGWWSRHIDKKLSMETAFALFSICYIEYKYQQVIGFWSVFYETIVTCMGIFLVSTLTIFRLFSLKRRIIVIGAIIITWISCYVIINIYYICC